MANIKHQKYPEIVKARNISEFARINAEYLEDDLKQMWLLKLNPTGSG